MILSKIAINRPVFTVMVTLALVVLGLFAYRDLSVEMFPDIDFPFVVVTVSYPGASPETMETEIVTKIEDAMNTVSGVRHITSKSYEGYAFTFAEFELEVNDDVAAQDVREKIAGIRRDLPDDMEEPVIQKYDPMSIPIISLAVSGDRSARELTLIAREDIKKALENIRGVGNVELIGGEEREILVELDLTALEAYNLSIFDVQGRVQAASLELPAGKLERGERDFSIRTLGKYVTVDQIANTVIKTDRGVQVLLRDIATVKDTTKEIESISRLNGRRAVGLALIKQSGANVVDVAAEVKARLAELRQQLPKDVEIVIATDNSKFTEEAVHDVVVNIIYGGILAVIVIFFFLADTRATIISAIAIPTSIIATFLFMGALNFTLNFMTLLALSLAVGLLIDDAIVVIENIYRHSAYGKKPGEAAYDATSEIALAVLATTFTIIVVFVPVAFMKGIVGRFFYAFGITVAVSVAVSLFVAFTLTPMLSSRWLRGEHEFHKATKNPIYRFTNWWNQLFERLNDYLQVAVRYALTHRGVVVGAALLTFVGSLMLVPLIGTEFIPEYDRGEFFVAVKSAPGTSLDGTARLTAGVEQVIRKYPEIQDVYTTIGSGISPDNEGTITVRMVDLDKRERSSFEVISALRKELAAYPGLRLSFSSENSGGGGGGAPVEISVAGERMEQLTALAAMVEDSVRATPGAVEVDNSLGEGKPELQVALDREKIADLGLNVSQIALAARYLVNGVVPLKFQEGDRQADVRLRLRPEDRNDLSDLSRILIPSSKEIDGEKGQQFPLSYVANFAEASAVAELSRYDRMKTITVSANNSGRFAGDVRTDAMAKAGQIPTPPGYRIYATGEAEIQAESFGYIIEALFLAIILIYFVLASQFESLTDPFAIMLSLPMSLLGAFLGLLLLGSSISIMSLIGIVMLMGLVTKNAILLVDFAKQDLRRGTPRTEAFVKASSVRLRPIIMTTAAMIFGMLPLALGIGPGAELRAGIARAVIGGLITSTGLTLVVVPVVYTLLDDLVRKVRGKSQVAVDVNN